MNANVLAGLLIPLIGTTLGAACVFFLKNELKPGLQKSLLGFASGVMVAASVWSLLIPSMELSEEMGRLAFVPALVGLAFGFAFLLLMDMLIPHLHLDSEQAEGISCRLPKTMMLMLAVTLHNIPEGMAVGVVFAGVLSGQTQITSAGALALSIGIAIQNFPEGAVISLPLRSSDNMSRPKAFVIGMLSGIVEPIGAAITILLSGFVTPLLPYLLSFAAGAMLYVVVEELIPEASAGEHSNLGTVGFAVGFALMMVLDVALG
ncbi:MAG: ZIP family metal transporter [Lachnospiraceae bacterium]|nr:ZIP family metal transporter [Lachnospiraceae bacterium]